MRKRFMGVILAMVLIVTAFSGCSSGGNDTKGSGSDTQAPKTTQAQTDAAKETAATAAADIDETLSGGNNAANGDLKVTALFFSLEGEYFSVIDQCLRDDVTGYGYQYESQSSNSDALTMVEQIENAVANGTDCIWIWSLNGATVADALKSAKDQGVKVVSFVTDPGRDACDVYRGSDNLYSGECISQLAIEWADRVYGKDAAEGSINTVLVGSTAMTEMKERGEGMAQKIAEDKRFNVLEIVDTELSTVAAQQITENMFNKYGDIDCFITTGGELALGVISYTTSPGKSHHRS